MLEAHPGRSLRIEADGELGLFLGHAEEGAGEQGEQDRLRHSAQRWTREDEGSHLPTMPRPVKEAR